MDGAITAKRGDNLVIEADSTSRDAAPNAAPVLEPEQAAPVFDVDFYLATYPDARAAIERGEYRSAQDHWFRRGRAELMAGRRRAADGFDEAAYLARRPDLVAAIAAGTLDCGYDHWLQWGRSEEGRTSPYPAERSTELPAALTPEKARFWNDNGYVVLEGLISPERCARVDRSVNRAWVERRRDALPVSIDVFIDRPNAARVPLREAPAEARAMPYKLNDMFLFDDAVRDLALDPDVCAVLRWFFDAEPACVGSLNFERGSTQPFHTDTLYMPGKHANGMAAAWFALEDVTPEAGPLTFYPGSHAFPLFLFSSGRPHQIDAEVGVYDSYMQGQVAARGLLPEMFLPSQGDVLIWHERFYHGGAPIEDMAQTRKSLVTHYWRVQDLPYGNAAPAGGGHYWDRVPL